MNEIKIYNEATKALMNIHSDGEMISLTDLWKESGSIANKELKDWLRKESTDSFIESASKILKVEKIHLIKIKRGKNGGTWGHKQIALEYAQYLDPKLAVMVNSIFFERIEEEKNPEKIFDRGIKTYKKLGKDEKWIGERFKGISTRNEFTKTLAAHGVEQQGFKDCTNAIYQPLFGGSVSVIREKKGLEKNQNVRDNMSAVELAAVGLSELLAMENIDTNKVKGAAKCELVCRHSSKVVASAIVQSRKSIQQPQTF